MTPIAGFLLMEKVLEGLRGLCGSDDGVEAGRRVPSQAIALVVGQRIYK